MVSNQNNQNLTSLNAANINEISSGLSNPNEYKIPLDYKTSSVIIMGAKEAPKLTFDNNSRPQVQPIPLATGSPSLSWKLLAVLTILMIRIVNEWQQKCLGYFYGF